MNWITALCVTNRHWMVRQAFEMFRAQTYGLKRMLFCTNDNRTAMAVSEFFNMRRLFFCTVNSTVVKANTDNDFKLVLCHKNLSLGALRNIAVCGATSSFIAQWDDDDIHGPERMRRQMEFMLSQNADACTLARINIHDRLTGEHYLAPCRNEGWENTLLARREALLSHPCPDIQRGEDSPPIEAMYKSGQLKTLDEPDHYTYVVHGKNVWDRPHFEAMFAKSTRVNCDNPHTLNWLKNGNWLCGT